jgi:hypothetical protein
MDSTRMKDWLIGAAGMVLLTAVAVMVLWWLLSGPAGEGGTAPVPTSTAVPERPPGGGPPSGLNREDVWLADVVLDAGTVVGAGSTLSDVRAVGSEVVTGPGGLVAKRLTVDATVPFDVVANELGGGTVVRAGDGGHAVVIRTVEALGRELAVTATGTVEVEAGKVVVEPRSIDFGGPDFLSDAAAAAVRGLVTIEHNVEGLPDGLVLQDVAVQGDGFRVNLRGEDVELAPKAP